MRVSGSRWIAAALGLWLVGLGVPVSASPEPVTLVDGPDSIPLGRHVEYLCDDSNQLTLEDVRSPQMASRFIRSGGGSISQGYTTVACWYRATLHSPAGSNTQVSEWVLETGMPWLNFVDIHLLRAGNRVESHAMGALRPPASDQLSIGTFALPFLLSPTEEITLYARVRDGAHSVSLAAWTSRGFQAHAAVVNLKYGLFYGVLLVMILYNLVIYVWIRDRAYLYYILYMASAMGTIAVLSGHGPQYLGAAASTTVWAETGMAWFNSFTLLFVTLFFRAFLQTARYMPRLHRLLVPVMVLTAAFVPLSLVVPNRLLVPWSNTLGAILGMVALIAGAYLSLRGIRAARFFLVAWIILLLANLFLVLALFGVFGSPVVAMDFLMMGICLEATLLSLALADRINQERKEKFAARHEALAAKEQALVQQEHVNRLKSYLPQKVAELVVGGEKSLLEAKRRQVTVCVIDLRGFTPFSETSAPEDVMNVLREFFTTMGDIVEKHGGTVEHFAGDSMLIFFNAPLEIPHPERQAIETALEMRAAFEKLQPKWKTLGYELGLGIGLANGYATIGAIGFLGRSQYAAIGAVTNLASRLCSSATHGEILTTARVLAELAGGVAGESVGEQTIRGFSRPVQVVKVLGFQDVLPA